MKEFSLYANFVDIAGKGIYPAKITVAEGKIKKIEPTSDVVEHYILPGFIDAHIHIESSMLIPTEFARAAVVSGTVATVSDPHEIANVLGKAGVEYMIQNARKSPLKFNFGAPSCVPATQYETAGATITADDIDELLSRPDVKYLSEMMNWPGVIYDDPEVERKLAVARKHKKPVDGHAPGLTGDMALAYIHKGITTDHECYTLEEARFKLDNGMKILIREGSAAKNFDALIDLVDDYSDRLMFCSDDKHPDDLMEGHINLLVKRALAKGKDLFKVLQIACVNPVFHYSLDVGLLRVGDPADFIIVDNFHDFNILQTWIDGEKVAQKGESLIFPAPETEAPNQFYVSRKKILDYSFATKTRLVHTIKVMDKELITGSAVERIILTKGSKGHSNLAIDVLKLVVVNRYKEAPVAIGFIEGFGLTRGALASSVAHDSHNIIAVGATDSAIWKAVGAVMDHKGGLCATDLTGLILLPLPVAGLMSLESAEKVAAQYQAVDRFAKKMGCTLTSPFMSLSFMALLVIPSLKLSDRGLFDAERFQFIDLNA